MIDLSKIEQRFNQWRGLSAKKEPYVLDIATKIASFNNENDLQNIQDKLTIESTQFKDFNSYRKTKELSCLFGTLFYMRLVIEDYTEGQEGLSEVEKQKLKIVLETLDNLYNYTLFYTGTKLDTLTNNIKSWLENHAPNPNNDNKDKIKELCRAFYTILTIINLNLETIPEEFFPYVSQLIGDVDNRKEQMAALLNQTIQVISQLEALTRQAQQAAAVSDNEEENEESASHEELDPQFSQTNLTGTPEPLDDEEHTENPTPHEEPSDNSPDVLDQENEEDSDEFYDAVSEQPAPITLEAHFDALSLAILTNGESTLQDKIQRLKTFLDQKHDSLNKLIIQKTQAAELGEQFNLATRIYLVCTTETCAHDIVSENKDDIDRFLMLMPSEEQDLWKQRLEKIAPPNLPQIATNSLIRSAHHLIGLMPRSSLVDTAKSSIPTIDREFKQALQEVAQTHLQKLCGAFGRDANQFSTGTLDDLKATIETNINELANGNGQVMSLLQTTPLIKLHELITKIDTSKTVITEYEALVNRITETRTKLKTAAGIVTEIDTFLANYDSFLVKLSLFVSYYLGSFFKTATADKVDNVSVIKTQIHESTRQLETTLEEALNSIKNNQQISETIKAEFVVKLESSFAEAPAQEHDEQANAPEPQAHEIQRAAAQPKIDREFKKIRDRFTLFAPPAPVAEAAPDVPQQPIISI